MLPSSLLSVELGEGEAAAAEETVDEGSMVQITAVGSNVSAAPDIWSRDEAAISTAEDGRLAEGVIIGASASEVTSDTDMTLAGDE